MSGFVGESSCGDMRASRLPAGVGDFFKTDKLSILQCFTNAIWGGGGTRRFLNFPKVMMNFHGFWWIFMGFHGDLMGFDGVWWGLMGFQGFWWVLMGFDWFWWGLINVFFRISSFSVRHRGQLGAYVTKRCGAARSGWIPLACEGVNVVFNIFYFFDNVWTNC